jgi:hypothetical protein
MHLMVVESARRYKALRCPAGRNQNVVMLAELAALEDELARAGAGPLERLHLALRRPPFRRPFRAAAETYTGLRQYGRGVRDLHGVSLRRQARGQWALHVRQRLRSDEYYLYQLYLPERRRAARSFIPRRRMLWLLYKLHSLTRPDLASLQDKRLFAERCRREDLPTPPILAAYEAGAPVAVRLPETDLFVKPAVWWGGQGALAWTYAGGGEYRSGGRSWTGAEVSAELERRSRERPLVVQERLSNGPELAGLTSGALCSARILTARRPDGGVDCLLPVVRLPFGSAIVDNFARGGLIAPVELQSGEITGPAVRLDGRCAIRTADRHPDTGETFIGFRLPHWQEAVWLALRAADVFADVPFVGWDVALLAEGPILLEGNVAWNADGIQLPHGRGLGETPFVASYVHQVRRAQAAQVG